MDKFQLEECLQDQKRYYIQHPDSEALKKMVSEANYDFEEPLQNTETLEYYSVDEFSDKERDILYKAYCEFYLSNVLKNKLEKKEVAKNLDDYFAVIYNGDIEVFPKEKLNGYLLKNGCLICNLKTARDYKKSHMAYVFSDEKWIRDYFGTTPKQERDYEKDLYYSENRFA